MKLNKFLLIIAFQCFGMLAFAQKQTLNYYLPAIEYDAAIPTPEQFLGWQIGEWHVSHDQLAAYMRALDAASERISLQEYGRSFEQRPMLMLTITSVANHLNINKIQAEHRKLCDAQTSANIDTKNMPVVVYQGHSIHGNEPSGANAAMLMAYYYAAAKGDDIEKLLSETVILLDPSFNPDGLQRFSTWVNMHKSSNLVSDPSSREFSETWPGGRTNHYWFDLNRDWLVAQMPESKGRVKLFQAWKPNILTDHHEMGTNGTYFFQPGVPSRVNPSTPKRNQELTAKIATYHAAALDKIGSMYYTEENFDDFYYGKGSTYPDINGCVGILFEQASSRGHAQKSSNGVLTFPFTIRNQVTTSFSTIQAARAMRSELLDYQRSFYTSVANEANADAIKGYSIKVGTDRVKFWNFCQLFQRNNIKIYQDPSDISTCIVPTQQAEYKLVKAIFDRQITFEDSIFYDISAWTLPLAFDIEHKALKSTPNLGTQITEFVFPKGEIIGGKSNYAYLMPWDEYSAPAALQALQNEGLLVKVAQKPFSFKNKDNTKNFDYGTIVIPVQQQPRSPEAIQALVEKLATKYGIDFYAQNTGLSNSGVDLGSPNISVLKQPKVLMLVGEGVNANDAGEIWHLLDQRYDMTVTMSDINRVARLSLEKYNCIVLPDGNYGELNAAKIKDFVQNGGTLIGFGNANKWLITNGLAQIKFKTEKESSSKILTKNYADAENDQGAKALGGAIFEANLDLTHPLCYGYHKATLPVFVGDALFLENAESPYSMPMYFKKNPLLSGYIQRSNLEQIKQSAFCIVSGSGSGKVISMTGNPNFRAFWFGTNKIFANALFFGNLIANGTVEGKK
jgi:hypothetical protein